MNTKSNFGKKGWLVIIYVLFLYMFSATPPDTLNVTVEQFGTVRFGMGEAWQKLLVFSAIGGFVGIPVALILGQIVAKCKVKWPTVGILVIYAIIWFLNGQANSIAMYAAMVVLITAVSDALNLVSTQQIMNNWFPKKKGLALGWSTMGMCFSSAIMVAVFQVLIKRFDLSAPFKLMTGICLVLALITIIFFKNYPEEAGAFPDNEPITEEEKQANLKLIHEYKSEFTFGKLLKTKELWALTVLFGFLFIGLIGVTSQMIPRLAVVGLKTEQAIMWLTISSIIGIFASFAWGWIDQKIGTKKAVEIFSVCWTAMMVVALIGMATVNLPITLISIVMYSCLLGGLGNLMPSFTIQIFGRYDFPQANKLMVPLVVGIRSFALLIVPAMLTAAGNQQKGYMMVFVVFAILSLIATIIAFCLKDTLIGKQ
ncbi:MAG: OFA family MFS transporter [Lachnospiraceae bacterium]|nr:OFA family MFS transporter [Lachnospiraceae bacterium]